MAGIYLHIPYCKVRCIYCDYYKETDETNIDQFTEALCHEAEMRKHEIGDEVINTIYLGGGTPSRLHKEHMAMLFDTLYEHYTIAPDSEITIEANPDDLTDDYINMLATTPINRFSIGIQSFDDDELRFLSRRHKSQQAIDAVHAVQQAGFDNISIDLMYGLPKQTMELWKQNLQLAMQLDVQHVSAYHLIYERETKLYTLLQRGRVKPVEDELSLEMFDTLIETLALHGFEQYETSNFAKDKLYSRHNTSYWQNKKYLGLGPSAHSYDGDRRSWNVASLERYIASLNQNERDFEFETLTESEKYNEHVLTGIRTKWGVDLEVLREKFDAKYYDYFMQNVKKHLDSGFVFIEDNHLMLARKGLFMTDGIASDLMWVD